MKTKNLLKKAFLLLALIGGASSAWATTKTFSLVSYTVTDGKYTVTDGATLTLGRTSGNIGSAASESRGFRWQSNMYFQIVAPSGQKVTSVTLTSNSKGNSVGSITYTLTDGTNNLSGSWDHALTAKQTSYTWTVTTGMSYGTWVLTNTSSGDIYFSQVDVTYETASTTNTAPSIVTQPTSAVTTSVGHETSLTVAASGYPVPTYQWYSCDDAEKTNAAAIGGATNATYTFTPASTGTYYYFCRATNNYDAADHTADSNVSTVTVNQLYNVTYSLGDVTGTDGKLPDAEEVASSVTIPSNWLLYKDGCTLTAWNDGSANHAIGSTFDVSSDVTLTPVFSPNGENAHLGYNATTVTWDFQTKNGAPTWQLEGNTGVQITQTTVGGSSIDVKLDIDATSGKLNNASWTDWAQFNVGTKLIVPVLTGAMVKLYTMNEGSGTTFGGNPADSYASNIHSYTATSDGDLEVVAGSGVGYVRYISVTYPSETAVLAVSAANETVGLTKTIINSFDYLTVATENWSSQTIGDYTGEFYNLSSSSRNLTIKVTGASRFEVYVKNSTADRTYKVKVGSGDEQTVTHGGTGVESSGVFTIADPAAETTITISGGGSSVYPGYFVFDPAVSITPANNKSTYVTTKILDFSDVEGLKAYVATAAAAGVVTMEPVGAVPAGTPLMLVGTADTEYKVPVVAEASAPETNMFEAGDGTTEFDGTTFDYILYTDGLFYQIGEGSVPVGKAYLHCDSNPTTPLARELRISFGDNITGIEQIDNGQLTIDNSQDGKFIENGKLVIVKNGVKYNAAGAQVK